MATIIAPPTVTRLAYAAVVDRVTRHLRASRGDWRIVPLPGSEAVPLRGIRRYVNGIPTCSMNSTFGGTGERAFFPPDSDGEAYGVKLSAQTRDEIACAADGYVPDESSEAEVARIRRLRRLMVRAARLAPREAEM